MESREELKGSAGGDSEGQKGNTNHPVSLCEVNQKSSKEVKSDLVKSCT